MITATGQDTHEYRGLSTDTKPTKYVGNGSVFIEMDTLRLFMFDGESEEWIQVTRKE